MNTVYHASGLPFRSPHLRLFYLSAGALLLIALFMLYTNLRTDRLQLHTLELLNALDANLQTLETFNSQSGTTDKQPVQSLNDAIAARNRLLVVLKDGGEFRGQTVPALPPQLSTAYQSLLGHWREFESLLTTPSPRKTLEPHLARQRRDHIDLVDQATALHRELHRHDGLLLLLFALAGLSILAIAVFNTRKLLVQNRSVESLLTRERERLQDYINLADIIFVFLDREARVVSINDAGCRLLRLPKTAVLGKSWIDNFIPPADRQIIRTEFGRLLADETGRLECFENNILDHDGNSHFIIWHNTISRGQDGLPEGTISAGIDVSQLKKTQTELAISEKKYQTLLNTLPYGVQEISVDGTILYSNPAHDRIFGYQPGQMQGMNICDLPAERQTREELAAYLQTIARERPQPRTCRPVELTKDGRRIEVEMVWDYLLDQTGNLIGLISVVTEVTEKNAAEARLRANEQMLRQLTDNIHDVFFVRDLKTQSMIYVSPAYETIWGNSREQLYHDPRAFLGSVHPEDRDFVLAQVRQQDEGGPMFNAEYRIIRGDGEVRWIEARTFPIFDDQGNVYRIAGLAEDITKHKMAEMALQRSAQNYRMLIEQASDPILIADLSGKVLEANAAGLALLGCSPEELTTLTYRDIYPPEELDRADRAFERMAKDDDSVLRYQNLITRDGRRIPVEISSTCIMYDGQRVAVGIFRDISERKRREAQRLAHERRQRQTLVREVHHRIKNNLQGLIGLLRDFIDQQADTPNLAEQAIGHIRTIALVHGLEAKATSPEMRLCDITEAIVQQNRVFTGTQASIDFIQHIHRPFPLPEEDTVPIALIVNELITNAVKHLPADSEGNGVTVEITADERGGRLRIYNRGGRLPAGFDLEQHRGIGVGLELVLSLMPRRGARLRVEEDEHGVVTELQFDAESQTRPTPGELAGVET